LQKKKLNKRRKKWDGGKKRWKNGGDFMQMSRDRNTRVHIRLIDRAPIDRAAAGGDSRRGGALAYLTLNSVDMRRGHIFFFSSQPK